MYFHKRPLAFTFHLTYTDNTVHYFWITAQADLARHKASQQQLNGRRGKGGSLVLLLHVVELLLNLLAQLSIGLQYTQ